MGAQWIIMGVDDKDLNSSLSIFLRFIFAAKLGFESLP